MNQELSNFIKYCLGYVKITREKTAFSQQNYSVDLNEEQFNIISLLNGTEGDLEEPIKLECFYEYDPKQVPPKLYKKYTEEKKIANGIEEIYNKHKNDQYTKQVLLNFGHFKIEIPKYEDIEINDEDAEDGNNRDGNFLDAKTDVKNYPLFTLPIRIDKCNSKGSLGKYVVNFIDDEIRVNIGVLYSILGEDKYHQLLEKIGQYEINGKLSIPICKKDVFIEIWQDVKSLLKLENINFDDNSFDLDAIRISLGPKANYFLAEDLEKLIKAKDEELEASSLFSWVSNLNEDLNIVNQNVQSNTTYFPFPYDKFQLSTLSIISNKASIIQGPPGTGKSETIANILCHLAANKKKILFVSQKPQALKVVKDKLKRLKVQYLFGYIPNLNSELLDDDDMNDGVSAQLGNLNNYIDVLENKKKSTDGNLLHRFNSIVTTENKLVDKFNQILSTQRRLNYLHKQIEGLSKYELKIDNHDDFINNFTLSNEKAIRYLYDKLDSLIELNAEFVNSIGKTKYKSLEILHYEDSNLVDKLEKILRDVEQTGYDRHSKLGRKLVNAWRWFRIGNIFEMLPRELADFVKSILELDLSRIDATKELKNLIEYFNFKNREFAIHTVLQMIAEKLKLCGLTRDQFLEIEKLLNSATEDKRQELLNKIRDLIILKKEVSNLELTDSCNSVRNKIKEGKREKKNIITTYLQNIINDGILDKWEDGVKFKKNIQRLSKAFSKSKKAFKTFDKLRKESELFKEVLDLIPIWIIELDDASRMMPLECNLFDYVILDEASQCNVAYTLPVMFRAKSTIFVGDSEQMRDSTIMFKSNKTFDELASRYCIKDELQIKATGTSVQSVLDIAKNCGFLNKTLRYHYRSPKELIGFSNKYFYEPKGKSLVALNNQYLTYKDTNRIMLIHQVNSTFSEEFADNINVAEAMSILEFYRDLRSDERYKNKQVGILTFFNAQAAYLRELFEKNGFDEDRDNFKIAIIEGIQGDEKDIIIYSFVIRNTDQKKRYYPLTGESGDIRADINKGRVNVAFSRARNQVHCFISMNPADFPEKIWIKKYLQYVLDEGKVKTNSIELKQFDSGFEEEFYNLLTQKLTNDYVIQNQVASCGFKIDFVVQNTKNGKQLAIECDGPTHFKDEIDEAFGIYVESDEERQGVLEIAGWQFIRVKYSDWVNVNFNREKITEYIVKLIG